MQNKVQNIINLIDNISMFEINELISLLEKKYDIKYNDIDFNKNKTSSNESEKKTSYSLFLDDVGVNKISLIKSIRDITELGLKEVKNLVDSSPVLIKDNLDLSVAQDIKKKLEDIGAKISIK